MADKKYNMSAHVSLETSRWDVNRTLKVDFSIIKGDEWTGDTVNTKCGQLYYKNLGLQGWMGEQYDKVLGADEIRYLGVYSATQYDLERMLATIKRINRKLDSIREKYGYPNSFDQFFLRLCNVLGVTEVRMSKDVWDVLGNQYVDRTCALRLDDACMWLRTLESKLCTKGKEKVA